MPRVSKDDGFTLIELMMVCVLMIIVIGIPITIGFKAFASQASGGAVSTSVSRMENVLDLMLNDARGSYQSCASSPAATNVTTTSSPAGATLTFWVPIRGQLLGSNAACPSMVPTQKVVWTCTAGATCTRQVGTAAAVTWLQAVTSVAVTASTATGATGTTVDNPARLAITLGARAVNDKGATLSDGVPLVLNASTGLRNFGG